jgi:hypothetical protein
MIAKFGGPPKLWFSGRATLAEQVVNKHRAVRNEAVVANRYQIANERVGLDSAPLPDLCPFLDFNERPDEGIIADVAAVQVCRLDDRHIRAECYVDEPYHASRDWIHVAKFS